jgi:hypothetical protein
MEMSMAAEGYVASEAYELKARATPIIDAVHCHFV